MAEPGSNVLPRHVAASSVRGEAVGAGRGGGLGRGAGGKSGGGGGGVGAGEGGGVAQRDGELPASGIDRSDQSLAGGDRPQPLRRRSPPLPRRPHSDSRRAASV